MVTYLIIYGRGGPVCETQLCGEKEHFNSIGLGDNLLGALSALSGWWRTGDMADIVSSAKPRGRSHRHSPTMTMGMARSENKS